MKKQIHGVYGASGCGRGVMPLLRAQHGSPDARLVFVDDGKAGTMTNGNETLSFEDFVAADAEQKKVTIAVADPHVRSKLAARCEDSGLEFQSLFAAENVVMDDVEIAEGAIFSPFTTVTSNVRIGRHFHCNINSYVEHDCVIGDFVTFAPAVRCNGNIVVEDHAYIGSGAVIRQGAPGNPIVIGQGAVVGMGAIVTKNIPAGEVVVGNPARPLPPG